MLVVIVASVSSSYYGTHIENNNSILLYIFLFFMNKKNTYSFLTKHYSVNEAVVFCYTREMQNKTFNVTKIKRVFKSLQFLSNFRFQSI